MQALGYGALKNAKISIALKVWKMMLMNWRQKFGLVWNNNLNWAASKDFIQEALIKTCQLPVVQGDTEGPFIPFHHIFTSVGNNFVRTQEILRRSQRPSSATFAFWR